ncbi:MAG: lysylphosphatidylglycerol synthase transmembrane domain-containing protein [Candidatus Marinimicrobia bacterium]|nr:lysylphosphatidylglycerol synthase transmembrane domain-containing protein [Candidatus Neomarinimicrobiota bacterium]
MQFSKLVKEHPLKFIISVAVSLGLVYFSFKDLDWDSFWLSIRSINYWILGGGGLVLIFSNVVRAARWRILLMPQKTVKRIHLFEATMMGYMGNNVLPFKLGEVLRAVVVSKRHGIKVSGVGASIVVERGLDMFSFLVLAGIYGMVVPSFEAANLLSGLGLVAIVVALVFGFWVNKHHDRFFGRIEKWSQKMVDKGHPKRAEHLISLFKGLETIWRMPHPIHVLSQTLFLWFLYFVVTVMGLASFNFGLSMIEIYEVSFILLIFTTLSLAIPAAPGYVGTYHGAVLAALMIFNIESDQARAFAIVLHLMNYLIYTPSGAWYLIKAGMTLDLATQGSESKSI